MLVIPNRVQVLEAGLGLLSLVVEVDFNIGAGGSFTVLGHEVRRVQHLHHQLRRRHGLPNGGCCFGLVVRDSKESERRRKRKAMDGGDGDWDGTFWSYNTGTCEREEREREREFGVESLNCLLKKQRREKEGVGGAKY